MLCDSCRDRDAVVHLTQIENNTVTQIHLCERCAAERGVETTIAEPKHPGRWGCPRCYVAFESSMRGLLRRVHGSSQHVGESHLVPRSEAVERVATLGELRERLRRAIETEQFELAADLRDRIRVLE
ncbi:MAG: hypothetical protein B7Z72_01695 [Gemmatimonadetes bacterium 21-71-4]|nr:MAG: hypothetical protein B7Z72_01695 [Gemmatimonadetes bacterium 21-71-4]